MTDNIAIVANSINIDNVPKTVKLLPIGQVKSQKGDFFVDKDSYQSILEKFKSRKIDLVIDYEHQTLENVQAPAGGWIKDITLKNDGIYAVVDWTNKASQYIKEKEYRYLSPVILLDKNTRKVQAIHSVALTNTPAIDGMKAIINSLHNQVDSSDIQDEKEITLADEEIKYKIAKELDINEDATIEDILKAIKELKQSKEETAVLANKLKIEKIETESQQLVQMALSIGQIENSQKEWAYKRCLEDIDGFKFFVQGAYRKECDEAVRVALTSGKIAPFQKEWARQLALKDIDCFKMFVKQSLPVIPLGEIEYLKDDNYKNSITRDKKPSQLLGLTDEEIRKYNK